MSDINDSSTAMRIVSLLPAGTEILCALGTEKSLSGVSHECDFPPWVSSLPRLTRSRLEIDGVSERIHESVSALVENALSMYEVDIDLLKSLSPDSVITQDLCDVCAVSYADVCAATREIIGLDTRIISLHPRRFDDLYDDIRRIGDAVGHPAGAVRLVGALEQRMARLRADVQTLPRKSVLLVEWLKPVMIAGLWSADIAEAAGAKALASEPGRHARTLDVNELADLDPDVIVIKPCGFDVNRTLEEIDHFARYLPWKNWRAVQQGRVFIVDGNAYFNRSGPRLVDSAEILAACVHEGVLPEVRRRYAEGVRRVYPDLSVGGFNE